MTEQPTAPQWICVHCFIHLVNGDCTEVMQCHIEVGCHCENDPLWKFGDMHITHGMLYSEHDSECKNFRADQEDWMSPYGDHECDCETITHSMRSCDGCGSVYHGKRHAVTGWIKEESKS